MFTLNLQIGMDQDCPYWFTETDSKAFCDYIFFEHAWHAGNSPDIVGMLKEHYGLDLDPLLKVSSADFTLEDWLTEGIGDEDQWRSEMETNRAAWQPPDALIGCLQTFLLALDKNSVVFSELDISESYFVQGYFKHDLTDLLRMVEWAKSNEARQIRLVMW